MKFCPKLWIILLLFYLFFNSTYCISDVNKQTKMPNYSNSSLAIALTQIALGAKSSLKNMIKLIEHNCNSKKVFDKWRDLLMKLDYVYAIKSKGQVTKNLFNNKVVKLKERNIVKEFILDFVKCNYNKNEFSNKIVKTNFDKMRKKIAKSLLKKINYLHFLDSDLIKRFISFMMPLFFSNEKLKTFSDKNMAFTKQSLSVQVSKYFSNFIKFIQKNLTENGVKQSKQVLRSSRN